MKTSTMKMPLYASQMMGESSPFHSLWRSPPCHAHGCLPVRMVFTIINWVQESGTGFGSSFDQVNGYCINASCFALAHPLEHRCNLFDGGDKGSKSSAGASAAPCNLSATPFSTTTPARRSTRCCCHLSSLLQGVMHGLAAGPERTKPRLLLPRSQIAKHREKATRFTSFDGLQIIMLLRLQMSYASKLHVRAIKRCRALEEQLRVGAIQSRSCTYRVNLLEPRARCEKRERASCS